ncbi:hypothetical protein FRIGORI9N_470187 [Frigoribacterium sp. 9N]|nr:hypothetical protein FRIGORI9N_470187 [Frigoribacterium sp. 9N]
MRPHPPRLPRRRLPALRRRLSLLPVVFPVRPRGHPAARRGAGRGHGQLAHRSVSPLGSRRRRRRPRAPYTEVPRHEVRLRDTAIRHHRPRPPRDGPHRRTEPRKGLTRTPWTSSAPSSGP